MKNNVGKIVGYQNGLNKNTSRPWTKLWLVGDFDYQQNAEGQITEEVYINGDYDVKLGDKIELIYSPGFQGKAMCTGIRKAQ